jgi:hypothetical protein
VEDARRTPGVPAADAEAEAPLRVDDGTEADDEAEAGGQIVSLTSRRSAQPREWNLWELESVVRGQEHLDPVRAEEWSYLFVHLRQFADADGSLPVDFDGLIRDAFGDVLHALEST